MNNEIVILGNHFSPVTSANTVTFAGAAGDIQVVANTATSTRLTVTVPAKAKTGQIRVTVNGKTAKSQDILTILDVKISVSLDAKTPANVAAGDIVVLYCEGILSGASKLTVKFGNAVAEIVSIETVKVGPTQIEVQKVTVRIPAGATSGPVTIATREKTAITSQQLVVIPGRLLPHNNCIIDISGLRVEVDKHTEFQHYENGSVVYEEKDDGTDWIDFTLAVDTRKFTLGPTGYSGLEQGFVENVYSFAFWMAQVTEKGASRNIRIELDPNDYALTAFSINSTDAPSVTGVRNGYSQNESKSVVLKKLHLLPQNSYEYELTGDAFKQIVEQILYSQTYSSYTYGHQEQRSGRLTMKQYEILPSAKMTIRLVD